MRLTVRGRVTTRRQVVAGIPRRRDTCQHRRVNVDTSRWAFGCRVHVGRPVVHARCFGSPPPELADPHRPGDHLRGRRRTPGDLRSYRRRRIRLPRWRMPVIGRSSPVRALPRHTLLAGWSYSWQPQFAIMIVLVAPLAWMITDLQPDFAGRQLYLRAGCLLAALGFCFALDDTATTTLEAVPVPLRTRRVIRTLPGLSCGSQPLRSSSRQARPTGSDPCSRCRIHTTRPSYPSVGCCLKPSLSPVGVWPSRQDLPATTPNQGESPPSS